MNPLQVRIISPKKILYNDRAVSISSTNSAGNFDILPGHANFLTLVENNPILIKKPDNQTLKFNFPLAIIYTYNNRVSIFTDISIEPTFS